MAKKILTKLAILALAFFLTSLTVGSLDVLAGMRIFGDGRTAGTSEFAVRL